MSGDWVFDAVQVEVAYRTEQLRKAGRTGRIGRSRRARTRVPRIPEPRTGTERDGRASAA